MSVMSATFVLLLFLPFKYLNFLFSHHVEKSCRKLYSRTKLIFWKLKTTFLHIYLFVCFWQKKLSFYLIFTHLVIETEHFICAFSHFYIFSNSLLTCLLLKSLKTVFIYLMKSDCCIYIYIPNYSFFIFYF